MNDEYLPVGSVVMLKGATRGIVVIGYSVVEEGKKEIWDYLGCAYPIGVINAENNLLFNKDKIEKVLFKGYTDEEGTKFLQTLKETMNKIKNN